MRNRKNSTKESQIISGTVVLFIFLHLLEKHLVDLVFVAI